MSYICDGRALLSRRASLVVVNQALSHAMWLLCRETNREDAVTNSVQRP